MPPIEEQRRSFQFGLFELNVPARELRKSGVKLKLQDQPLQVLLLLLERPGEIVSRDEIQKRLWPDDTDVDFDNAINSAVRKLRDALADSPQTPRYVETLARRGYRFIAPVSRLEHGRVASASAESGLGPAARTRGRRPSRGRSSSTSMTHDEWGVNSLTTRRNTRTEPVLSNGSLPLPHLGDCTHEGHPRGHSHASMAAAVAANQVLA